MTLKQLRAAKKVTQENVASYLGISRAAYTNIENGKRDPDTSTLRALAAYFEVTVDSLLGGPCVANSVSESVPIRVPVLGTIPAGIPLEAVEDIIDWEEIPADMARGGKEYFGLKVRGDSMAPRYEDGDVLILRKQDTCESGQDCAVIVNGGEATFKRVRIAPSGVALHPLNPNYETLFFTNSEVSDLPVRILGVVVELRRKI